VSAENDTRKLKIHKKQNKHKHLSSTLYVYRRHVNYGICNDMSVNTSGVPLNSTKPKLDGRIMGGTETDITSHPYQVWPLRCSSVRRDIV